MKNFDNINSACRTAAAEGIVLLKNESRVLPLKSTASVAVFGRMQTTYYKSGTGSGGLVHLYKEPSIIESLETETNLVINQELLLTYKEWIKDHPFDDGGGVWAGEPWFQEEMPVSEDMVLKASKESEVAIVVIGRTGGEDHDNTAIKGCYYLTDIEEKILSLVTKHFENVIVALNVGNIIDLSVFEKYSVKALLYIWQGGMEGTNAFADVLVGRVTPSGKLTDTQAISLEDYPSNGNFANLKKNYYKEDIYVGYRYFETFARDRVKYPFGFGLSYTDFKIEIKCTQNNGMINVFSNVTNTGVFTGRETIQVYFKAPCGVLGTPARQLIAYKKTKTLMPGESENVIINFSAEEMAAFDDSGITGNKTCFVLEKGEYEIFIGTDVRSAKSLFKYNVTKTKVVSSVTHALAPSENYKRLSATVKDGTYEKTWQDVPQMQESIGDRISSRSLPQIEYMGDLGFKLSDVKSGKCTMNQFISQLSDQDLCAMVCGEGMNSPKATAGTGGAFGGQTESLYNFGIPVCCVTDGPSGIRLDDGRKASLVPNGAMLACTWDDELIENIYEFIGGELKAYEIDALLGPGINIRRHPLCGRNFEYFSEDPYLTGKIAIAMVNGIAKSGSYSTIKHFCCNNQENGRSLYDSVVSERALREIYLKPFEMVVKGGKNILVMTAYNSVNGFWTASNYDLTTTILREDWGFNGFVMTDWCAKCNDYLGSEGSQDNLKAMVRAQNDVYMVCDDAIKKSQSAHEGLKLGFINRGDLQRCVKNILNVIIDSTTFEIFIKNRQKNRFYNPVRNMSKKEILILNSYEKCYKIAFGKDGDYDFEMEFIISSDDLSQNKVNFYFDDEKTVFSLCKGEDTKVCVKCSLNTKGGEHTVRFEMSDSISVGSFKVFLRERE